VNKHDERYYEAELYRFAGTLALQSAAFRTSPRQVQQVKQVRSPRPHTNIFTHAEAEAEAYLKAIEIAQRQEAKSWSCAQ
jgi:hypothetical protein